MPETPGDAAGEAGVGGAGEAGNSGTSAVAGQGGESVMGSAGEGGAGGSAELGPMEVTDAQSLWRAQMGAFCSYLFHCDEGGPEGQLLRRALQTEQRCREVFADSALRAPSYEDLDAKVRAGTIELDLTKVPACIDSLSRCEPEVMKRLYDDPACRAVFRGSSPLGGACSRAEDCADDARCVIDAACPGHCAARVALGQPCASSSDCDDHDGPTTCDSPPDATSWMPICAARTLQRKGLGEACGYGVLEAGDVLACNEGLFCDYTTHSCQPILAAGSACDSDDDVCADGQFCRNGLCQALTIQRHVGDDCDDDYIEFCDLFSRLYCVNQKCELVGDGTEGAPCDPIDYSAFSDCNPGLVCLDPPSSASSGPNDRPLGTCGKPRAPTAPCEENDDCASEFCQADGTCGAAYCCGEASCQSN
jgi:hypothetical protein